MGNHQIIAKSYKKKRCQDLNPTSFSRLTYSKWQLIPDCSHNVFQLLHVIPLFFSRGMYKAINE